MNTNWSQWSGWSHCTKLCGACGKQIRIRTCLNMTSVCNSTTEKRVCNRQPCFHPHTQMCCTGYKLGAVNGNFSCISHLEAFN
ncbi:unnamed protein product [Dracunculus medinensis]|uniref:PLAC domain-containing protein n=1 Tax=Dracunculus medinensis TaxID=318479 RepID=A0A0N4U4F2_DRAME|nr:unnamed protein product [Dracunculus medinensis]